MTYSLISATIPTFQTFLQKLNTGFGGIGAAESGDGYGYGSRSRSHGRKENSMTYQMSKLRSANKSVALEETDEEQDKVLTHTQTTNIDGLNVGPGAATMGQWNRTEVANGETTSIGSDESRRMMIRKEVQWSIRTESRQ
jgi:hypothetical protein